MGITAKAIGIGLLALIGLTTAKHLDNETYEVVVTKTERTGGDDGKYLVFGRVLPDSTTRVFENTDALLRWK